MSSLTRLSTLACLWVAGSFFTTQATLLPHSARLHRRFTFVAQASPQNWSSDSLEDYDQYHFRYLSIGCHQKKDEVTFFEQCCHPRLKYEKLDHIPVECHLDPPSMIKAHEYILKSTDYKGEMSSGSGKPVYVSKDSINVLQPEPGHNASEPPTETQIEEILKTQANIQKLNQSLNLTSSTTTNSNMTLEHGNLTEHSKTVNKAVSSNSMNQSIIETPYKVDAEAAVQVDADAALKAKKEADADAAFKAKQQADADAAEKAKADAADKAKADAADKVKADAADKAKAEASIQTKSDKGNHSGAPSSLAGVLQVYGQDGGAKGTFFYQEGAAGACGNYNSDDVPLVALPTALYDGGKHCGKSVMIKNTANGKQVVAKVQDMCPGCPSDSSLDLSTGAYNSIGDPATGVLPIEWGFM